MIIETRTPLFREALGAVLREERRKRSERLADVAARAGISTQYLSEIERGRKDPSSEMIEAVSGALGTTVGDVTVAAGRQMTAMSVRPVRLGSVDPIRTTTGASVGTGATRAYALAA